MEDAHVGVVDVCEHYGVELCSGCGVGGRSRNGERGGTETEKPRSGRRGDGDEESRRRREGGCSSGGSSSGASASTATSRRHLFRRRPLFLRRLRRPRGRRRRGGLRRGRLLDLVVAPGRGGARGGPGGAR